MSHATTATDNAGAWAGGLKPFKASYGKLMMWFFLMSDAFTFSTLLIVYGTLRFSADKDWANPETVFTHFPGLTEYFHMHPPLAFVGLMTFILIASSVTMVLAVEAGNRLDRKKVEFYMILTIIGGFMFVACQGYEWFNFIRGSEWGGLHLANGSVVTIHSQAFVDALANLGFVLEDGVRIPAELIAGIDPSLFEIKLLTDNPQLMEMTGQASGGIVEGAKAKAVLAEGGIWFKGANLHMNEYSQNPAFADLFFFITGFHGSHVFSGVVINYIIYENVRKGTYEKRGHYEMVEKVGLYWHFVDLVWVFVFTFFYLV